MDKQRIKLGLSERESTAQVMRLVDMTSVGCLQTRQKRKMGASILSELLAAAPTFMHFMTDRLVTIIKHRVWLKLAIAMSLGYARQMRACRLFTLA